MGSLTLEKQVQNSKELQAHNKWMSLADNLGVAGMQGIIVGPGQAQS